MKSSLRVSKLDLSKFKKFVKDNKKYVSILKITRLENPRFVNVNVDQHSNKIHVGMWQRSTKKRSKKRSTKKRPKKRSTKKRSKKRSTKKRSKKRSTKKRSKKRSTKKRSKKRSTKKRPKKRSTKKRSPKKSAVRRRHYNTSPSREKIRSERPSPSTGASSQKIGTVMKGNDGNMYKVIKTSTGIRRWVKK
jgi:hypothetical protein